MYIEQIFTGSLAAVSYYIESSGEAAVIDPMRDADVYLSLAEKRGASIRFVFVTHFHADFISGHLDIARKTGATIVFGPTATAGYEIRVANDGEEFGIGNVTLRTLHTPGHTLESVCFLLLDERQNPHSIFTGDTVFVQEVGRPDLMGQDVFTTEKMAGMLFDSIQTKILPLPNYVNLYPGHGAGSVCGKAIGAESHSTIGEQRTSNYALGISDRALFINAVTEGLSEPPKYFFLDAAVNRKGYRPLEEVLSAAVVPVAVSEIEPLIKGGKCVVLDTRSGLDFCNAFIPGSVHIGIDGPFALTAGTILDPEVPICFIADRGREREVVLQLARIGYENVIGYLDGGFEAWAASGKPADKILSISADDFEESFRFNHSYAIDVRNSDEWIPGFVAGAQLIPISRLESEAKHLEKSRTCYVYCGGGYRSVVAASLLRKMGFSKIRNVKGGMTAIKKTRIPVRQLSSTAS